MKIERVNIKDATPVVPFVVGGVYECDGEDLRILVKMNDVGDSYALCDPTTGDVWQHHSKSFWVGFLSVRYRYVPNAYLAVPKSGDVT